MEFKTKRLQIKPIRLEDREAVLDLLTDETVGKTYMLPEFSGREAAEPLFRRLVELSADENRYVSGVYLDGSFIGIMNETETDGGKIEMGYAFLPMYHNRGYASEAFSGAIGYLFHRGFETVTAGAFSENAASIRVMEKCGMKKQSHTDKIAYRGVTHTCVYYAITKAMENKIQFVRLNADDEALCKTFELLMYDYIAEMNAHSHRPLPEQFQKKWIDSILAIQGPPDRHLELCYADGVPVGFLYGKIDHEDHRGFVKPGWGYIMEFYVKPEYRRRGIGKRMLLRLEGLFRNDGAKEMYLTADPVTGKPFWEAMGFANTGEQSPENQLEFYEKTVPMNVS